MSIICEKTTSTEIKAQKFQSDYFHIFKLILEKYE